VSNPLKIINTALDTLEAYAAGDSDWHELEEARKAVMVIERTAKDYTAVPRDMRAAIAFDRLMESIAGKAST
jgi:hypothetical protein